MSETECPSCLVVDDDRAILAVVSECLQSIGYKCVTVLSAEEALSVLACNSFDLMITDLSMGGMDGIELTKRVRKSHPVMQVIVMTGFIDDHSYDEAIAAGASDFLKKPFTMNEMRTRVGRVVRDAQIMALLRKKEKEIEEVSTMMISGLQEEAHQKFKMLEAEIAQLKVEVFSLKTP